MKHGNNESQRPQRNTKHNLYKIQLLIFSLLLVATMAIGGSMAFLTTQTNVVVNTFTPAEVGSKVEETFDGTVKSSITVQNTGDIDAYIRVKLVTYRVNENKEHIGGKAEIPEFKLGDGWVEHDGYYYYTRPVAPNKSTEDLLGSNIELKKYDDANDPDGGKQAIDVMAEAIQSTPASAVQDAWGVTISNGSVTAYAG